MKEGVEQLIEELKQERRSVSEGLSFCNDTQGRTILVGHYAVLNNTIERLEMILPD